MEKEKEKSVNITLYGKTYNIYKILNFGVKALEGEISIPLSMLMHQVSRKYGYKNSDLWAIVWACVYTQDQTITYNDFLKGTDTSGIDMAELQKIAMQVFKNSFAEEKRKKGDSDSKN